MLARNTTAHDSPTLEPAVIVGDVPVALVIVPEGCLSPLTICFLATGYKGITVGADVLAALGKRTTRPAGIVAVSIPVAVSILATICILATVSILATIAITPLVGSGVSVALKASVDVLDLPAATLKVLKLGRLPSTTAVVAGGV
jgi:hypothetical protein